MSIHIAEPRIKVEDANGLPYVSARLYVYQSGTTTLALIFSDAALSVPATNPLTSDSSGYFPLTYIASGTYKLKAVQSNDDGVTANGTAIWSADNQDTGLASGTGSTATLLSVAGTATTATLLTNIGAASASGLATSQADISALQTKFGTTGATTLAAGTTIQEPAAGTAGKIRFNTDTGFVRIDNGVAWKNIPYSGQIAVADLATGFGLVCLKRNRNTTVLDNTLTVAIPADGTAPQITEGEEVFSTTFTPISATSTIRVRAILHGAASAAVYCTTALFKNGSTAAIAAELEFCNGAALDISIPLEYEEASTGSAVTFSLRGGGTSGTFSVDTNGSSITLGGLRHSYLIVEEWLTI